MFNSANSYKALFETTIKADFVKCFPNLDPSFGNVIFSNDTGSSPWADAVLVKSKLFHFYIGKLYSNCGCSVLYQTSVDTLYRRKGIGNWLMKWQLHMMISQGFTLAIATTNQDQGTMCKILEKHGWKYSDEMCFTNTRTDKAIKFWYYHLSKKCKID
jgi:GNAT superfamily N-acetyltransferase